MSMAEARENEKGSISITLALFMGAMVVLFLAAVAHSQYVSAFSRLREASSNSARVAAQAVSLVDFASGDRERVIDEDLAEAKVREHLELYSNVVLVDVENLGDGAIRVVVSETVTPVRGLSRRLTASSVARATGPSG